MRKFPGADLKTGEEDIVLDWRVVESDIFEGNNGINVFPHLTAPEFAWIDL